MSVVASKFNIPIATVITSRKSKDAILKLKYNLKRAKNGKFTEIEVEVLKFVTLARSLRLSVTETVLSAKIEFLRYKYGLLDDDF